MKSEQPATSVGTAEQPDWTSDHTLDASDMRCPLPVLKARKRLAGMKPGERLLLLATDPMAAVDVPHFCRESGHELLRHERSGETHRYLICRA